MRATRSAAAATRVGVLQKLVLLVSTVGCKLREKRDAVVRRVVHLVRRVVHLAKPLDSIARCLKRGSLVEHLDNVIEHRLEIVVRDRVVHGLDKVAAQLVLPGHHLGAGGHTRYEQRRGANQFQILDPYLHAAVHVAVHTVDRSAGLGGVWWSLRWTSTIQSAVIARSVSSEVVGRRQHVLLLVLELLPRAGERCRESAIVESASANYLDSRPFIVETDRATLVDWIVDGHCKLHQTLRGLHRAVHIMDRYVSCSVEIRVKYFKLVGAAALLVTGVTSSAQVMPRDQLSRNLLKDMNNAITHHDLQAMFDDVVKVLNERAPLQTACDRIEWLCKVDHSPDDGIALLAQFTADRALQEYKLLTLCVSLRPRFSSLARSGREMVPRRLDMHVQPTLEILGRTMEHLERRVGGGLVLGDLALESVPAFNGLVQIEGEPHAS